MRKNGWVVLRCPVCQAPHSGDNIVAVVKCNWCGYDSRKVEKKAKKSKMIGGGEDAGIKNNR